MPEPALRFTEGHTTAGQLVVSLKGKAGLKQLGVSRTSCIAVLESKRYPWVAKLRDQALRVTDDGQKLEWPRAKHSFSIAEFVETANQAEPLEDMVNFHSVAWNLPRRTTDFRLDDILDTWWFEGTMFWLRLQSKGRATYRVVTKIRGARPAKLDHPGHWQRTNNRAFRLTPVEEDPDARPQHASWGEYQLVATDGDCLELLGTHGAIRIAHILKRGTPPVD